MDDLAPSMPPLRLTLDEARRVSMPADRLSAVVMAHGSMELHWYAPHGQDPQTPHDRDEVYVVAVGTAVFVRGEHHPPFADAPIGLDAEDHVPVGPGDVLFVPAGTAHRFEFMTPDFGTWSLFYGPEGGEAP